MVNFERAPRDLIYPDGFSFPALQTALTGYMINDKGHSISMAIFLPHSDIKSIFAISPATGRIIEDDKLIIQHALTSGQAVVAYEHYGSGLSTNPIPKTGVLGSKDFYELGQDFLDCINVAKRLIPDVPVNILGCSMGATVALHAAVLQPDIAEHITCGAPFIGEREINLLNRYRFSSTPVKWLARVNSEIRARIDEWEATDPSETIPTAFDAYCDKQKNKAIEGSDTLQQQLLEVRRLNPQIDYRQISKQWVLDAADACHRLQNARAKFLSQLKGLDITVLHAMEDELVDNKSVLTLAERLAAINPNVRVIGYQGASHNLMLDPHIRQKILSDVEALTFPDNGLEPTTQDFRWYHDPKPTFTVHKPLHAGGLTSGALRAASWHAWSKWGGTKPPVRSLIMTDVLDSTLPSPATLPPTESAPQALELS